MSYNLALDHIPFFNAVIEVSATERLDEGDKITVKRTEMSITTDSKGVAKSKDVKTSEQTVNKRGRKKKGDSK